MLIATKLAASVLASSLAGIAAPVSSSIPPMIVNVTVAADVAPSLVTHLLAETDAIWRVSGLTFVWRMTPREVVPYARITEAGPYLPTTLHVVIGNDTGAASDSRIQLGWIVFADEHTPEQEVYVSYRNSERYLLLSQGIVGVTSQMTMAQRHTLLGRVMGRALAHELGHYLLASKVHTPRGLMQATRTATDFFSNDRRGFVLDTAQRVAIASRLLAGSSLVVRQ